MSQSKSAYKVRGLEGNEQRQRQRQKASERKTKSQSEQEAKPACWRRHVDDWNWHTTAFSAGFAGMYGPCTSPECFPNDPPDVDAIEEIVRSCSHPTAYHRLYEPDESCGPSRETSADETATATVGSRFTVATSDTFEPLGTIAELEEGNGVIWNGQSTPLVVVGSTTEPTGVAHLLGPHGGDYRIDGRPHQDRSLAVYPGVGFVTGACRIIPADERPKEA